MEQITYLNRYFAGPKPGSKEWLDLRSHRFGGSEFKDIDNVNSIIKNRKRDNSTNICCWWGKWFEIVAKQLLNVGEIYEYSAIPCAKIPYAYTPDGLFIKDGKCCLLEIKCPFVKENTNVKDYNAQIQMGLFILPVDYAICCIFQFRKCDLAHLKRPRVYDVPFHKYYLDEKKYKPLYYSNEEISSGALIWKAHDKCPKFHYSIPDQIIFSKDVNVFEYILNMETGHYLCFKCFKQEEHIVKPDQSVQNKMPIMWQQYKEFLENND